MTVSRGILSFPSAVSAAVVAGVVLMLANAPAMAQGADTQALLDRIERLERDIRTLNRQLARAPGGGPAGGGAAAPVTSQPMDVTDLSGASGGEGALARLTVRMDALERDVRQVTGIGENLTWQIDQLTSRLDKLAGDIDYRLSRLEGSQPGQLGQSPAPQAAPSPGGMDMAAPDQQPRILKNGAVDATSVQTGVLGSMSKTKMDTMMPEMTAKGRDAEGATPAPASTDPAAKPASVLPEGTSGEQYDHAFSLVRQRRYDDAEAALKAFINAHGGDPLASNARYWLGETHYVRKQYLEAAQTFFESYKDAPKGPKAQDSLLKLGMSMGALDKADEACATFSKLRSEFSGNMRESIERLLVKETQRLKCK
ncbi:MAG: tol-pal system protein YbgF [Alphaproteobacteria bacterium]|nr:tol-pal system protein YbgF [Alphaproteobacteria bacterium]